MITLYQLHWSHYVEKVRWALDYKGVEWRAVNVDPFSKREMRHLQPPKQVGSVARLRTVPAIQDDATGAVVDESSEILGYLERAYPTPALYPSDPEQRKEVERWTVWLDSTVGLAARRLAYTQIAVERPGLLAELFVPKIAGPAGAGGLKGKIAGRIIAGVLSRRFRFHRNRADGVFEQLEQCLLFAAKRLSAAAYLVGDRFSAADLTLAALLRPVTIVPFFRDHPRLQRVFAWRAEQIQQHRREPQLVYESALHAVRERRGWAKGSVSWLAPSQRQDDCELTEIPALPAARNDHQELGRFPELKGAFWYLQLRLGSGLARTNYA
jgi:glutathione S-transferase